MRNTDLVKFVGFSMAKGKTTKVRFTVDAVRRTKVLSGDTNVVFFPLPTAMTKADALKYLSSLNTAEVTNVAAQEAISRAAARLIPNKIKKAQPSDNVNTVSSETTE